MPVFFIQFILAHILLWKGLNGWHQSRDVRMKISVLTEAWRNKKDHVINPCVQIGSKNNARSEEVLFDSRMKSGYLARYARLSMRGWRGGLIRALHWDLPECGLKSGSHPCLCVCVCVWGIRFPHSQLNSTPLSPKNDGKRNQDTDVRSV